MNETPIPPLKDVTPAAPATTLEKFAETGTAARLSGKFHTASGTIKRKVGELVKDENLKKAGVDQELLGKIHTFVGIWRDIRDQGKSRIQEVKTEGRVILKKHGTKLFDVANEFSADIKKLLRL